MPGAEPPTERKRPLGEELRDAAASVASALLVGVPMQRLIDSAPSHWFARFNILGPSWRPWLVGAAFLATFVPAFLLVLTLMRRLLGVKDQPT